MNALVMLLVYYNNIIHNMCIYLFTLLQKKKNKLKINKYKKFSDYIIFQCASINHII